VEFTVCAGGGGNGEYLRRRMVFFRVYSLGYNRRIMFTINTTHNFDDWYGALKDRAGKARIAARIDRAEDGNFGDSAPVGEGVSEMRIHVGPGYRVYWKRMDGEIVILLAGGDKSTQQNDIALALQLARLLKEK
jgi:putative addiction module killer protein